MSVRLTVADSGDNYHNCQAPDNITRRFCAATRGQGQESAELNDVLNELISDATDHVAPLFKKWQLSRGVAEIAACKAVEKAVRMAQTFDCRRPILPWVRKIARNEAMNIHRTNKRLKLVSLFTEDGGTRDADNLIYDFADRPHTETILDDFARREDRDRLDGEIAALLAAIKQLPSAERLVVEGRLSGLRNRDIAKVLRTDNQSVAVLFSNAKHRLRRALCGCLDSMSAIESRQQAGCKSSKKTPAARVSTVYETMNRKCRKSQMSIRSMTDGDRVA